MRNLSLLAYASFVLATSLLLATEAKLQESSVGMPARIEALILPGTELEAQPIDREREIVLRIVNSYPHGSHFRYDMEFYGLEPGEYDLRDYVRRKDGTSTAELPPLVVKVNSLLPPGQPLPHELHAKPLPWLGGYRLLLVLGGILWTAGLVAILFSRRRAKLRALETAPTRVSFAEQLRPLLASAVAGRLTREQQAELERLLVRYWRSRLDLTDLSPHEAIAALREHPEAGQLLRQVEAWLHSPEGAGEIDIAAALAPYQNLPDEEAARPVAAIVLGAGR